MKRRQAPEINAGSMADIAFLLLIFWLVATTITPEFGIKDKLVDPEDEPKIAVVTESRDLIRVHVNADGTYTVSTRGFDGEMSSEKLEEAFIYLKRISPTKGRVIITSDYDAPFKDYIFVVDKAKTIKLNIIENEIKKTESTT